ncbi:hypothetical protein PILCRDRAFT_413888 [Piloderma croceum F 1598]|uniref:Uncharacterized protein n=1 Tax=Piloderma croceum (strain F 1598) TaxID=765440 RepID=A0A0C3FW58_PILCF|nr:hypothetical protein PILCRDRAFT_413888 [Piloderma croceum F 1598]
MCTPIIPEHAFNYLFQAIDPTSGHRSTLSSSCSLCNSSLWKAPAPLVTSIDSDPMRVNGQPPLTIFLDLPPMGRLISVMPCLYHWAWPWFSCSRWRFAKSNYLMRGPVLCVRWTCIHVGVLPPLSDYLVALCTANFSELLFTASEPLTAASTFDLPGLCG